MRRRGHPLGALGVRGFAVEGGKDALGRAAVAERDQVPSAQRLPVSRQRAILGGGVEELENLRGTLEARGALRQAELRVAANLPTLRIARRKLLGERKRELVVVLREGGAGAAANGLG